MPSDQHKESTNAVYPFAGSLQALNLGALTVSKFGEAVNWTNDVNFKVPVCSPWVELPVGMFDAIDVDSQNDVVASVPAQVTQSQAPIAQQVETTIPTVIVESSIVDAVDAAVETVVEPVSQSNDFAAEQAAELAIQTSEVMKVEAERAAATKQAAAAERLKNEAEAKKQSDLALAESQRLAAEHAESERVAAEQAAAELAAANAAATKIAAAEQAESVNRESERALAEQAESASAESKRLAAERLENELAEANRLAAEKVAAGKQAAELAESALLAKEQSRRLAEQKASDQEARADAYSMAQTQTPVGDLEPMSAIQASRATRVVASQERIAARSSSERIVSRAISPPKKLSGVSSVASPGPTIVSTNQSTEDYLAKLERLVLELNMELGRRRESEEEDPIAQLSQRIIELNLENMDLRERLQISEAMK